MNYTNEKVIAVLRTLARQGTPPSQLVREAIAQLAPDAPHPLDLVEYFTEAFCFAEGQAYPIFGLHPDGLGKLSDADFDRLMTKRIEQTRKQWDESGREPFRTRHIA